MLKKLAIEHEVIFGTPNQVLRRVLGLEEVEVPSVPNSKADGERGLAGYPSSVNPPLQQILDSLRPELDSMTKRFEQDSAGRFVSRPQNFVTIKVQERVQDLAVTVYGRLEEFEDLRVSFEMKSYRPGSYSSFKVSGIDQVVGALLVI